MSIQSALTISEYDDLHRRLDRLHAAQMVLQTLSDATRKADPYDLDGIAARASDLMADLDADIAELRDAVDRSRMVA